MSEMPRGVRSRNGCAACKAQRLKCDEAWPACGRCIRLRTRCSGPVLRVRWSHKHQVCQTTDGISGPQSMQATAITPDPGPSSLSLRASPPVQDLMEPYLGDISLSITDGDDDGWIDRALDLMTMESMTSGDDSFPDGMPMSVPMPTPTPISTSLPAAMSDNGDAAASDPGESNSVGDAASPSPVPTSVPPSPASLSPIPALGSSLQASENPPNYQVQRVDRLVNDYGTMLVEFYFRDTAPLLAQYDSNMNPFRSTVSHLWSSDELMYYALQSLAAAFLSNTYPQMSSIGSRFRRKAMDLFQALDHSAISEQDLMALFMIGGTASWFDVNDNGLKHFALMKTHVQRMTASGQIPSLGRGRLFFKDLLTCWEMFLAFIVDSDKLQSPQPSATVTGAFQTSDSVFPKIHIPHPMTGVASDIHAYVARVGRLVRSNRRRVQGFVTRATILQLQEEMEEATELEAALTASRPPSEAEVVHMGDMQTPNWHLTTLADAYRRVGLLQLYRVFPDTRMSRMSSESPDLTDDGPRPMETSTLDSEEWLRCFALRTIDAIRSIPAESGTKDYQPFLLVASCSELTLPAAEEHITPSPFLTFECYGPPSVSLAATEIHQARGFLMSRLQTLQHALPKKPIQRCIEIVEATWTKMDSQNDNGRVEASYWMDVMIQNSWEIFMA